MSLLVISEQDKIRLEEFPLAWRWTQESHAIFNPAERASLTPLRAAVADQIVQIARSVHTFHGLQTEKMDTLRSLQTEEKETTEVRQWLSALPIVPEASVIVSWDATTALVAPWRLFIQRWDDFCYPSSDDVTVFPLEGGWVLACYHYERLSGPNGRRANPYEASVVKWTDECPTGAGWPSVKQLVNRHD